MHLDTMTLLNPDQISRLEAVAKSIGQNITNPDLLIEDARLMKHRLRSNIRSSNVFRLISDEVTAYYSDKLDAVKCRDELILLNKHFNLRLAIATAKQENKIDDISEQFYVNTMAQMTSLEELDALNIQFSEMANVDVMDSGFVLDLSHEQLVPNQTEM
ncbi:MAG: hypothetical protein ABIM99_03375 [Candidatus Dojkabacteria bacterium]